MSRLATSRSVVVRRPVLAVVVWSFLAVLGAAAEQSVRMWTDTSGTFEVKAALVAVEKDNARLRKPDGTEIVVPLERLSKADREYAAAQAAGNPFERPAARSLYPSAAGAVVSVSRAGSGGAVLPGLVFHSDGKRSYVFCGGLAPAMQPPMQGMPAIAMPIRRETTKDGGVTRVQSPPPDTAATIAWGPATQPHTVSGEVVGHLIRQSAWLVAAPAKELPAPLPLSCKATVNEPMKVRLFGYEIAGGGNTPSFARVAEEGYLKRVYRKATGEAERFVIESASLGSVSFGIVTTEAGEPIACFTQPATRNNPDNAQKSLTAWPLERLASLREPELESVAFMPVKGRREIGRI